MSWHNGRLAAFDLETTGTDVDRDRIVTAALSAVGGDRPTESRDWLIDPGIEIPAGATAVHGITTETARSQGRDAAEAIEEITAALAETLVEGTPIVAFNARFDLTFIDREARRHGLEPLVDRAGGPPKLLVIDPYVLDKQFDRFRKGKRTLENMCEHYGIGHDGPHSANADAVAAARLAWKLGETVPDLNGLELAALCESQISWAAEQAASLQEYFERNGRSETVEGAWPMVPLVLDAA